MPVPDLISHAAELAPLTGVALACLTLGLARATFYRHRTPVTAGGGRIADSSRIAGGERIITGEGVQLAPPPALRTPPLALTEAERQMVRGLLTEPRFVDCAPRSIHATLLDEGRYLASPSTFYRLLRADGAARERRDQLAHPAYAKPELLATGVNQVWSWDITRLKGPAKWNYFYLYVILDIFSRYAVGWMLQRRELGSLAKELIETCVERECVPAGQLTLHADRGGPMKAKPVAFLLADLGVTKSHSRPHTSDDNPFSESQFKTLKTRPDFPRHFDSIEHARAFCTDFFVWYNHDHRHSGIGFMTPHAIHYGLAPALFDQRASVLAEAFLNHPLRFKGKLPLPPPLPTSAGINWPKPLHAPACL